MGLRCVSSAEGRVRCHCVRPGTCWALTPSCSMWEWQGALGTSSMPVVVGLGGSTACLDSSAWTAITCWGKKREGGMPTLIAQSSMDVQLLFIPSRPLQETTPWIEYYYR